MTQYDNPSLDTAIVVVKIKRDENTDLSFYTDYHLSTLYHGTNLGR